MKLRVAPLLAIFVSLVCVGFLGYRGYQWWEKQQKRKALFLYFQKNSPVTKRIPSDAVLYVNLYDFKRVHDQLRDSKFSQVLAHWLDTGMSENEKPNPLLGGMLEKTILNIIGDEFAIALVPSQHRPFDVIAVARIAAGSDFLLNLALSSAKNVEKIDSGEKIFYRAKTKDPNFPEVILHVQENLAYASNDFGRLKAAYSQEGGGPDFLRASGIEGIPEDTALFAEHKDSKIRALLFGSGKTYRLQVSNVPEISAHPPEIVNGESDVIKVETNGPGLVHQPAATYLLQSVGGNPVSGMMLGFSKPEQAARFEQKVVSTFQGEIPESFNKDGIQCIRRVPAQTEEFLCRQGVSLLMAQGQFPLTQAKFLNIAPAKASPFILRVQYRSEPIAEYRELVDKQDWSRFSQREIFYFLSCIKQIAGGIDQDQREIAIELE